MVQSFLARVENVRGSLRIPASLNEDLVSIRAHHSPNLGLALRASPSRLTMASLARTQVNMQSAMVYSPPQRKGPPHSSSFLSRVSKAELRGTNASSRVPAGSCHFSILFLSTASLASINSAMSGDSLLTLSSAAMLSLCFFGIIIPINLLEVIMLPMVTCSMLQFS